MHVVVTLSFLNQRPLTTFARFIAEARAMPHTPAHLGEMLDVAMTGRYQDLEPLRGVIVAVVEGLEQQFRGEGVAVVDADLDPGLPNRRFA